jgi:regulator of replication initiation timing
MPIETYDSADAVPEEHRDTALALADGKFAVVVEEDVSGLKANAARILEEKKQADKERRELAKRLGDLEREKSAAAQGITSDQLAKLKADVEAEYAPLREEAQALKEQLRGLKLDKTVQAQMAKAGVRGERVEALWKLARDHFDLTDDGEPYVKVAPGTSIEAHIAKTLKTDYPEFFAGTAASGGGAPGSRGAAGAKTVSRSDTKAMLDPVVLAGIVKGEIVVVD